MATTVQISDSTKQMLDWIKTEEKAATYDEVIQHVIQIHTNVAKSMFGAAKVSSWNKKKDRLKLHEL